MEVTGETEINLVWEKVYENLGKDDMDNEEFDKEFAHIINNGIKDMEEESRTFGNICNLEDDIKEKEIEEIVKKLTLGKAGGKDEIVNEILKYGGKEMVRVLWILCSICFDKESIPKDWIDGIIFPIYKNGDKRNPLNYRGITLLSMVSKVYTGVLSMRLTKWCEENKILGEEQGGFRTKRGCIDQIFVLEGILNQRKKNNTYCCFIDLKKAFDRVWRNGLWKALWDEGIRGKMWRVLRSLYEKTRSCIKLNGKMTNTFNIEVGVRQGCVLSPLLFSIFINNLAKKLKQSNIGIKIGNVKIASLFYADDIVLIAENEEDLKK